MEGRGGDVGAAARRASHMPACPASLPPASAPSQAANLAALSPQLPLAAAYLEQARGYVGLSPERRTQLCQELLEGIARLDPRAGGSAVPPAGVGTPTAAARPGPAAGPGPTRRVAASRQAPPPLPAEAVSAGADAQAALGPTSLNGAQQEHGAPSPATLAAPGAPRPAGAGELPGAEPAAPTALSAAVSAASPPAELPGMAEWTLTYAEQCERPFVRPDVPALRRPVPVVFDLETSGEQPRCMCSRHAPPHAQCSPCCARARGASASLCVGSPPSCCNAAPARAPPCVAPSAATPHAHAARRAWPARRHRQRPQQHRGGGGAAAGHRGLAGPAGPLVGREEHGTGGHESHWHHDGGCSAGAASGV